ncbi:hypothetical protein G6L37_02715 [Agrobacterium rubi]|nr:hypothetical protein [Agrobacterium rubi]NTF24301.1 hypothetical protein [Agrobacterium rubi]
MPVTTDRVIEFAAEAFRRHLGELLDDPTWLVEEGDLDPVEYIAEQRRIAADLGIDFDSLSEEIGSPFEVERLRRYAVRNYSSPARL